MKQSLRLHSRCVGWLALLACLASPLPAAAQAAAVQAAQPVDEALTLNLRPDERRSEQPLTVDLFDRPVILRLGYELSREQRRNFDLNRARDRDRRTRDQELKLDARVPVLPQVVAFAQVVGISEVRKQPATGTRTRAEGWQRGEMWLRWDGIAGTPLALQAGRIPLVDKRTFWWDEDLDAVRLMARGSNWTAETGIGRELARAATYERGIDLQHRGVRRWFGQASWTWRPRQVLEAFWLQARDRSGTPLPGSLWSADDADPSDARLTWAGVRASGNARMADGQRWAWWADAARVSGHETLTVFRAQPDGRQLAGISSTRRVRGHAIDFGASWTMAQWLRPTLTLGFAQGSGSAPGSAVDRNFRQTGLQENKARLSGVKRLQRYGAVLDPSLANLQVATASFAVRPLANTSIELVAHQYRQRVASDTVADMRLSQSPAGINPRLGHEIDLLLAWRESRHVEVTLLLGRFYPGAAFAANRRDPATSFELGLALNY